jgi:hypothetical protein
MGNDPPEAALLRRGTSRPAAYGPGRFLVILGVAQAGETARLDQETGQSVDAAKARHTDQHILSDGPDMATTGDRLDHQTIKGADRRADEHPSLAHRRDCGATGPDGAAAAGSELNQPAS